MLIIGSQNVQTFSMGFETHLKTYGWCVYIVAYAEKEKSVHENKGY